MADGSGAQRCGSAVRFRLLRRRPNDVADAGGSADHGHGGHPTTQACDLSAPALTAPYNDPISYLIAVVSGEIKPTGLSALDTNVIVVRILDAARESARTGRTIRLADRGKTAHTRAGS